MGYLFLSSGKGVEIIPLLIVCLVSFYLLSRKKNKYERNLKERETEMVGIYDTAYQALLAEARKKQNDYQKHMLAIYYMGLTADSKEELVNRQVSYADNLETVGKFDSILTDCENPTLAGYLYYKCTAVENADIVIDYVICVGKARCMLSVYQIIEMLTIFMDYAVESLSDRQAEYKRLMLKLEEDEEKIVFEVGNPEEQMSEEKLDKFFKEKCASQGEKQNTGLSHAKQMIEENKLQLTISNNRKDGLNWRIFRVVIDKNKNAAGR